MPTGWLQRILFLCAIVCLAIGDSARGGVPAVKPIGLVLELQGELDHLSQIEDIRRGVAKAKADGAQLVVLAIHGRAWRYDIVRSLAELVATAEPPVAVYVADGALGVALAGARANAGCWTKEELTLQESDDAIEYVSDAKPMKDDAKAWVKADGWSVLKKHDALRAALIDPRRRCWLIESKDGTITTVGEEPAEPERKQAKRVVALTDSSRSRVSVSIDDAAAIGLLTGRSASADDALRAAATRLHLKNLDVREPDNVGQELEGRRGQALRYHQELELMLVSAQRVMIVDQGGEQSGPGVKNMKGAAALTILAGAKVPLARLETLLSETPEIQRMPAPGQSSLISKRSVSATRWRSIMEKLNERFKKLEKQATEFRDAK